MKQRIFLLAVVSVCGIWSAVSWAHGAIYERIQQVEANIAREPGQAKHYIERSHLYTEHGQYDDALSDLEHAARLEPDHARLDYERARVEWYNAIDPETDQAPALERAQRLLAPYLRREPDDYQAHQLMARILDKQEDRTRALAHYERALERHPNPGIELFLERARLLRALGRTNAVLVGLDEAVQRIGPVKELIDLALELELARGNADGGLYWLEQLPEDSAGLPSMLIVKGNLLMQLNRQAEAVQAHCRAKAQLDQLSDRVRESPRISQLIERIGVSDSDCMR